MEIKPPNLQPPTTSTNNIKSTVDQWRSGQIIDATLISKPKNDTFTLKIGSNTLQATGTAPSHVSDALQPGTKLKLLVLQTLPQLTLKVLPNPTPNSPTNEALKQHLPKQTSLAPLLANLASLTKPAPAKLTSPLPLPVDLASSIKHLISQLPRAQSLSKGDAETLKKTLKESGLFLEKTLTQVMPSQARDNALNRDFKANLLKVLQQLQNYQPQTKETSRNQATPPQSAQHTQTLLQLRTLPPPTGAISQPLANSQNKLPLLPAEPPLIPQPATPPLRNAQVQAQARSHPTLLPNSPLNLILNELGQQIEGALSRLRVTQLANIPTDNTQLLNWSAELPIRRDSGTDLIQLRIEEKNETSSDGKHKDKNKAWKVTLAFDFEELGPMYASISLHEHKVGATLHAEHEKTAHLINANLNVLSGSLIDAGLTIDKLSCHQGKPASQAKTRITHSLLDLKA